MNIPTELWYLIFDTHHLDIYLSCLFVNKTFYKIVNHYWNSIPNNVQIKVNRLAGDILICDNASDEIKIKLNNWPNDRLFAECCKIKEIPHECCIPVSLTNPKDVWQSTKQFESASKNKENIFHRVNRDWIINIPKHDILLSKYFSVIYVDKYPLPIKLILSNKNKMIHMKARPYVDSNQFCQWFCYHL